MTQETPDLPLVDAEDVAVQVIEYGDRPRIMTRARTSAPQAAQATGALMGERRFAQYNLVVLDWTGNAFFDIRDELAKPLLIFQMTRWVPEKNDYLTVRAQIDIDSVFSGDAMDRSILLDLVNELGLKIAETLRKEK